MNKRGFARTLILVIVGALVLAGGLYFLTKRNPASPEVNQQPQNTIAGWKTYTNKGYGFRFEYPNDYLLTENKSDISIESPTTCATTHGTAGEQWPKDCFIYDLLIQGNKISVEGSGVIKTATQIAGYPAERIEDNNQGMWDGLIQTTAQFNKDGQWYISTMSFNLGSKTSAENLLNQVFSTFAFIP